MDSLELKSKISRLQIYPVATLFPMTKLIYFLQNIEVTGDKEDSRSLHITVHKPATSHHVRPVPLLVARLIFDDHIRCMAAKQRLTKGRMKARQQKMQMIERLLDIPTEAQTTPSGGHFSRTAPIPGLVLVTMKWGEKKTHTKIPNTQAPKILYLSYSLHL